MSFINYSSREINCKIVYYGPGLCGKTTNLQYIYDKTQPGREGQADLARHRDGAHALLRLPAALARRDPRLQDALPPLHGARPGLLRRQPQAHPEGRGRRGLRRRHPDRAHGSEHGVAREPARNLPSRATTCTTIPYVIQYNKRDLPERGAGRGDAQLAQARTRRSRSSRRWPPRASACSTR